MLAERWNAHNPELGPSMVDWVFFGPLEVSGLATYDRLNHDEYSNQYGFDGAVLAKCLKNTPDFIFITTWLLSPLEIDTLEVIKEQLGIPIVVAWGDAVSHWEEVESLLPFVDLSLVDISERSLENVNKSRQGLMLGEVLLARDPRIFFDADLDRDIDVSFLGSTNDYSDRIAGISSLESKGIAVFCSGGQSEERLTIDEYAKVLMRSKITLNFCLHAYGMLQLKPHIFEGAMCGAMVLEADNPFTARYFEPMVDYVPFSGEKDLVDKVRYYLANDNERQTIAANGYQKVREKYSCEAFWRAIIEKVSAI